MIVVVKGFSQHTKLLIVLRMGIKTDPFKFILKEPRKFVALLVPV